MDWCSVYLTPQGLPKYIYLSPPLIFPTTCNGIRTKNRPVSITPGAAPIRWMGPILNPRWEQKRTEGYVVVSMRSRPWRPPVYQTNMLNLGVCSARSLKQSMGRYVAPIEHIILILSQAVFTLTFLCCVLSGEAARHNLRVFGFTRTWRESTIYHNLGLFLAFPYFVHSELILWRWVFSWLCHFTLSSKHLPRTFAFYILFASFIYQHIKGQSLLISDLFAF